MAILGFLKSVRMCGIRTWVLAPELQAFLPSESSPQPFIHHLMVAFRRQRQEGQKIILNCVVNIRPGAGIPDLVFEKQKKTKKLQFLFWIQWPSLSAKSREAESKRAGWDPGEPRSTGLRHCLSSRRNQGDAGLEFSLLPFQHLTFFFL
jgi:hypothetical protein